MLLSGASGKFQGSFSVNFGFILGDFSCYFPGSFFDRFLNRICIVFGSFFDVFWDHFPNCFDTFVEFAKICKIAPRAGESSKIRVGEV